MVAATQCCPHTEAFLWGGSCWGTHKAMNRSQIRTDFSDLILEDGNFFFAGLTDVCCIFQHQYLNPYIKKENVLDGVAAFVFQKPFGH